MTVSFILVFIFLYYLLNLESNLRIAFSLGFMLLLLTNVLFASLVYDMFIKDIIRLRDKIRNYEKGESSENFDSPRVDEIGDIFRSMGNVAEGREELRQKVKESSHRIEKYSTEIKLLVAESEESIRRITTNILLVNDGTNNQVRGIEDVEFSIEEMVSGLQRINHTVSEVANSANNSVNEARKGNTALENVVKKMNNIQKNAEDSMQTIQVLGDRIKEVQQIVDIIRSISSRTNLLALNATIEAERAGENGEGFVVVAEEIKDLAIKSTESTTKIENITRTIVEKQEKAIEQIEKNNRTILDGINVVNGANQAFNQILLSTGEIGNQLNEASSSSEQLSTNTKEIVESVERASKTSKEYVENTNSIEEFVEHQGKTVQKLNKTLEGLTELAADVGKYVEK